MTFSHTFVRVNVDILIALKYPLKKSKKLLIECHATSPAALTIYLRDFSKYEIAPVLRHIINKMTKDGYFPSSLKIAKIVPIYKQKGEKCDAKNYRPISILPAVAKIIEKILCKRLTFYMEKSEIMMKEQHGYRYNRSTQSAVTVLTDSIKLEIDNTKKVVGAVFVDFQQAETSCYK